MFKRILINFLKDKAVIIGIFIFNTVLLMLFFNMEEGTRKEVLYPLVLSGFSLVILLITEWFKYYSFNLRLLKMAESFNQDLRPITSEQREISRVIAAAFEGYASDVNSILIQNKNRSYFLSQWIHNLKTPVSVIDLIAQKCSLEGKDPYVAIEDIRQENGRLHSSIEQLLTIIRLEDFQRDYEPERVDLLKCIKKLLKDRKRQFIASSVFPELKYGDEEVFVLSDKKWNEIMLEQVISNAIKYSREEGKTKVIHIDISLRGDRTLLSIRDEGIGIPSYDIERVFEPFFTGENGRAHRDSTGIGLYISSEISKKLGHGISIKSELKVGTEVIFEYLTAL